MEMRKYYCEFCKVPIVTGNNWDTSRTCQKEECQIKRAQKITASRRGGSAKKKQDRAAKRKANPALFAELKEIRKLL